MPPSPPSGTYTNSVNFDFARTNFSFSYNGPDGSLTYKYAPRADGTFHPLSCVVNGTTFLPSRSGGVSLMAAGTEIYPWQSGVAYQLLDAHSIGNDILSTQWKMTYGTNSLTCTYQFQISGRTLTIHAGVQSGVAGGLYLDRCENAANPVIIYVPYLVTMNVLYNGGVFGSMFFDWETTSASAINPMNEVFSTSSVYYAQQAKYSPRTDGSRVPVNETIYLTVSPSLDDVLPNVPNPQSPYKNLVSNYLIFDNWQKSFSTVANEVQSLHNADVSNLWVIVHEWQNGGYDNKYPNVLPANAGWGGDAGLQNLSRTTRTNGYLFSLHENYVDFYTNAASWNPADAALNSDGSLKRAWFNEKTHIQSYLMKPTKARNYANTFSAQIHSNYITTASFLDVHSSVNPSVKVDYDASTANAAMFTTVLSNYRTLFGSERNIHKGPVSGEGYSHLYYVGYIDDAEAEIRVGNSVNKGQWLPLLVNFDLFRLHGKTQVHGVGYYERFYCDTNGEDHEREYSKNEVIEYMATEIAYGHGGFIPQPRALYDYVDATKLEQKHVFPVQKLYGNASPTAIRYHDPAKNDEVTVSDYIRRYPATHANSSSTNFMGQVRVTYDNGVIVCVNRHPSRQWQVQLGQPGGTFDYNAVMHGTNAQWVGVTNLTSYLLPATNGWVVYAPN